MGANGWVKLDIASGLQAQQAFTYFSSSTYEIKPSKRLEQTTGLKRLEKVELVTLWNMEATANENRWALMSGGEAGSWAQTLIAPSQNLAQTGFHLSRSGTALGFKKSLWGISPSKREGIRERQSHQQVSGAQPVNRCRPRPAVFAQGVRVLELEWGSSSWRKSYW